MGRPAGSKNKHKGGMPSKYTKKNVAIILDNLSKMQSKTASSEAAGITLMTFNKWYRNIPVFKEQVDKTLQELEDRQKHIAIQSVFSGMDKDPKLATWWLERKHPQEYGKRDSLDINERKVVFQLGVSADLLKGGDINTLLDPAEVRLLEQRKEEESILDEDIEDIEDIVEE